MARYVVLFNFTDQGIRGVKDTVERAEAFWRKSELYGVRIEQEYWTRGPFDIVTVIDAPDDESLSAALLDVASLGNVRTSTLRAFTSEEMTGILQRIG